jgi:hypothetical protein
MSQTVKKFFFFYQFFDIVEFNGCHGIEFFVLSMVYSNLKIYWVIHCSFQLDSTICHLIRQLQLKLLEPKTHVGQIIRNAFQQNKEFCEELLEKKACMDVTVSVILVHQTFQRTENINLAFWIS